MRRLCMVVHMCSAIDVTRISRIRFAIVSTPNPPHGNAAHADRCVDCTKCAGGKFDICVDCYSTGSGCGDPKHAMLKLLLGVEVKDGQTAS